MIFHYLFTAAFSLVVIYGEGCDIAVVVFRMKIFFYTIDVYD